VYTGFWWGNLRGRLRHRWEDNIKMDLHEVRWGSIDWVDLAQDMDRCEPLVNVVMNICLPSNAGNFLTG
jgi:hypothetical protein